MDQFIPGGVQEPFISPHPDGGALIFWTEEAWDQETRLYSFQIRAVRLDDTNSVSEVATLVEGTTRNVRGESIFSAPVVSEDGSFSLLISDGDRSGNATAYSFSSDFVPIGMPRPIEGIAPLSGSVSLGTEHLNLSSGLTVSIDPDGVLTVLSPRGDAVATEGGLGSLIRSSLVETGEQSFALLRGPSWASSDPVTAVFFEINNDTLEMTGSVELDLPSSYRDPIGISLDGQLILVSNTREWVDTPDGASERIDTVYLHAVGANGAVTLVDQITFPNDRLAFSEGIVATPDGGFAILISAGFSGVDDEFILRRYDADGVFRGEQRLGENLSSTNNGGYDHQLHALADGSLLVSWQTRAEDGGRHGGHLFQTIAPEFYGTAGADVLVGLFSDDLIFANEGDDVLSGGEGNDTLDGGEGSDTAVFAGAFRDYQITETAEGVFTVADAQGGDDGTDQLLRIEAVQFSDGTFDGRFFTANAINDVPDTRVWDSYVDTFDTDGNRVSRDVTYDDGRVAHTTYAEGVVSSRTVVDAADAFAWTEISQAFDENGHRISQANTFDDGRVLEVTFEDGLRSTATMTDARDARIWETFVDIFGADGNRVSRDLTYDDGRVTHTTYADGVVSSRTVVDAADAFVWSDIEQTFDESGLSLSQTTTFDDGRVLVTSFDDGVRSTATMTDANDARVWESYVDTYDADGNHVSREMTFDDGRELFISYVDEFAFS